VITINAEMKLGDLTGAIQRQAQAAMRNAVQFTAHEVRVGLREEAKLVFDKPTPFTLSRTTVVSGDGGLAATVRLLDSGKYLNPQIVGGSRPWKRFEFLLGRAGVLPQGMYAIPTRYARMDAFGNMSRGQIVQILAWFSANGANSRRQNMTDANRAKRAAGTRRQAGYEYIAIQRKEGGFTPGVYEINHFAAGTAIRPVLIFVRTPMYRQRWDFSGVGKRVALEKFGKNFARALKNSMEGWRPVA